MAEKITISLPEEMASEYKDYARRTGRTFSGLVRVSLREKVEGEKDSDGQ